MPKTSFYSYTFKGLETELVRQGFPGRAASHLFNWFYKKNSRGPYEHQNLSRFLKKWVVDTFDFDLPRISHAHFSADRTVKFVFELRDGARIESVLLPFQSKYSLCISSQAGCGMKCSFCSTGRQGFLRHLDVHEIVGQVLQAKFWLEQNRPGEGSVQNVVFMGQGEPLHNFDAVRDAVDIFISQHGLSLADHKITVSTSGYLPGLARWTSEMPPVNLAVSLHSVDNLRRSQIIPLNKKYPLTEIMAVIDQIPLEKKRFITFEYLLLGGFNDSDQDAIELGYFLRNRRAFLNLIPFNPFPGSEFIRPEESRILLFKNRVESFGFPVTVRSTKGHEILAACGQLNLKLTESTLHANSVF